MAEKILYAVNEVIAKNGGVLPLSRSTVYKLVRDGKIPGMNLGGRVFIFGSFIERLKRQDTSTVSA